MNRWLVVAAALASPAFAQSVDVDVDAVDTAISVPGMNVNIRARGSAPAAPAPERTLAQPPPAAYGAEHFSVECAPMNGVQPQTIKVLSPEGASAQVWDEAGELAGQYSVPFNFKGRGNRYYRFILTAPDGRGVLDRKLEVKDFIGCVVQLRGAAGPAVAPAPAPSPAPQAAGMDEGDFAELLAAIEAASFSNEKTGVVATAAQSHVFTVAQVGRVIDLLSFSADKLKALDLLRGRLVDRQNAFKLLGHFTFAGDKQKAQALLKESP